uniref:Small ribosomal subunit protein uS3m n=1 Tax=Pleurotus citrinopileatus TaxID=98342 RepID=A0A2K9YPE2_PLECI|nr:ribosomal protein S3 [Pleurotus citrinopileatus]AUW35262.1 ribosomal protein S3 [Pleurotus citrinopileatus]
MSNSNNNNLQKFVKFLPLFGNPVLQKTKRDRMLNKYNVNMLNSVTSKDNISNPKINSKLIKLSNVLGLYLKGLNLYNYHLNKYIETTNKKELILYLKKQNKNNIQNLNSNTIVTQSGSLFLNNNNGLGAERKGQENTFNSRTSNLLNILNKYLNFSQNNSFYNKNLVVSNKNLPSLDSVGQGGNIINDGKNKLLNKKVTPLLQNVSSTNFNLLKNRKIQLLKRLSVQPFGSVITNDKSINSNIKSSNIYGLIKNNSSQSKGSQGIAQNILNFSSLDLPQKVFIKKNMSWDIQETGKKSQVINKESNKNLISNNYNFFNTLNRTKELIKSLNLAFLAPTLSFGSLGGKTEGKNYNSLFIFGKKYNNPNLNLLDSYLNTNFGQINSQNFKLKKNFNLGLSKSKNNSINDTKIRGLNLLEIIVSSLIAIKILNSKILIKKNKIKLLKYINLTLDTQRRNNLANSSNFYLNVAISELDQNKNINSISLSDPLSLAPSLIKDGVKEGRVGQGQTAECKSKDLNNNNNKFNYIIPVQNKIIPVIYNNNSNPIINQYIKAMTIFNSNESSKGSIFSFSSIIGYNFLSKNNKLIKNVYKFLSTSFYSMYCLISKPVFVITPDKVIIQLFYYLFIPNLFKHKIRNIKKFKNRILNRNRFNKVSGYNINKFRFSNKFKYKKIKKTQRKIFRKLSNISLINLYPNKFKKICLILSRFFKKPVELDLIRLHYPYNDSNILVNLLGIMINRVKIRIIIRKLFRKAIIKNPNKLANKKLTILPAFLSGMNIRIAGRLLTQKVIPRITVKTIKRGALAKSKVNFSDVARLTKKNKRGAFSITISSGQNFN